MKRFNLFSIKSQLVIAILMGVGITASNTILAQEMPPAWPWHGVSIQNTEPFDPVELEKIVNEFHINSIQIRLLPRLLAERQNLTPAEAWTRSIEWGDRMLDECKHLGIVAIMTVEGGFPLNPKFPAAHESVKFWSAAGQRDEIVQTMSSLSKHYAYRGKELVAYQILSEPLMLQESKPVRPPQWEELMSQLIKAVRKNDAGRWIAIAPPPGGGPNVYKKAVRFSDTRIIYGAHMYIPLTFTHQGILDWKDESHTYPGWIDWKYWDKEALRNAMMPLRNFQLEYQVPVWIGEFSAISWSQGADQYLTDVVDIFDEWNWSWTYFSWNGYFGWQPNVDAVNPEPIATWPQHIVGNTAHRWKTLKKLTTRGEIGK